MERLLQTFPKDLFQYIQKKPQLISKRVNIINNSNPFMVRKEVNLNHNLSFMTWNILASGYTSPSVYFYVKPEYLDENHRMKMMAYDIMVNNCDVVLLQEVEKRNYEKFLNQDYFPEYTCLYEKRPGLTCDGLAIMYKNTIFRHVDYHVINLNSICLKFMNFLKTNNLTHNLAQIIVLEPVVPFLKKIFDYIIVVNLHLYWDPEKEIIKYSQLAEILNNLNKIKSSLSKNCKVSVFVCGDFNSKPDSNVIDLIKNKFESNKISKVNRDLFEQISKNKDNNLPIFYDTHENDYFVTNIKPDFTGKLDYIFYTNEKNNFISKDISICETKHFTQEEALPNSFHGSDHIYLTSKFYC